MPAEKALEAGGTMDVLTFVASLVGSVAWPVAVFSIAFLFRAQLRRLLDRIKRFSLGENSVDFGERLDEAEAVVEAAAAVPEAPPAVVDTSLPDERTSQLIALSPAAAVLDTWRSVEREVKIMAESLLSPATATTIRVISFKQAVKALLEARQISGSTYSLLYELQQLRNSAAHSESITAADAIRFTSLAKQALALLDGRDVRPDLPAESSPANRAPDNSTRC